MTAGSFLEALALALGSGGLGGLLSMVWSRKKGLAEGRETEVRGELQIVAAANGIVATMREELARVNERMEQLELEVDALRTENRKLRAAVSGLERENEHLAQRCAALEAENAHLRKQ